MKPEVWGFVELNPKSESQTTGIIFLGRSRRRRIPPSLGICPSVYLQTIITFLGLSEADSRKDQMVEELVRDKIK